ncbi:MAG: PD-(D/E)XK nuclease family protein [Candidatus Nealsonbacteria bacterium]|nr:PD-(D/E)XK nuclease family protein [Candidatus Nealsonbacteria bacterium]
MYKLSPSDFAFLYEECKLCYCLKIKHGIYQPSMPMPGVFSAINTRLQGSLIGKNLKVLSENLPEGEVISQEGWVESIPVPETSLYIKGKYDLLAKNHDGTSTLVDLKISQAAEDKIEKYKTQLAAYKFALENPIAGEPIKIARLGLLLFYPDTVSFEGGVAKFNFPPKWLEVPINESNFLSFIKDIDKLLSGPMPEEGKTCKWCQYRHVGENLVHDQKK